MPLFSLDIEKLLGGEYWTNRYLIEAADLGQAVSQAGVFVAAERSIHKNTVTFTKYRVSDTVPGTDNYSTLPINQQGQVVQTTNTLPLFNVVRVDFGVLAGRPSRKYLRLPLMESEQADGRLEQALIDLVEVNYVEVLRSDTQGFVDPDGQPIVVGSVSPLVGMRQLRRGSKRKLNPVIPN